MKNLLTLLFVLTFFITGGFAQTAKVQGDVATLNRNLSQGIVEFVMPAELTSEVVNKAKQYYTDYFTVEFDSGTHIAKVKLKDKNNMMGRKVITRFLLSSGVRQVVFNGKEYSLMMFFDKFLNKE